MEFKSWRIFTSSFNFLIFSPCSYISSIDFINFSEASGTFTGMVDGIYVVVVVFVVVVLNPVRGTASSGITVICTLCYFSLTNLSNSASISFICAFCSIINFSISSLWPSLSSISFAFESSVARSFNYFLRYSMSSLLFFNSSLTSLTL
jgi:hypothetical protein